MRGQKFVLRLMPFGEPACLKGMSNALDEVQWKDGRELGIRGLAWKEETRESPYDRFPLALKSLITPNLWGLSTQSAGLYVEFEAATKELFVRWILDGERKTSPFDAEIGRSGLDVYGQNAEGRWFWVGNKEVWREPNPDGIVNRRPLDGQRRRYRVYLPLMRRIKEVAVGCREGVSAVEPAKTKPIAYYGTSIVHGAGISRAGATHAALLGRAVSREVYNLGFCGSAYCETAVAEALGRLDPDLFIVDVLPNNSAENLVERLPAFVRILSEARPSTPIMFLGDRDYGDAAFCPERKEVKEEKDAVLTRLFGDFQATAQAPHRLHLSESWYGKDNEGTVDASHPNDLGAFRMAEQLIPLVRACL